MPGIEKGKYLRLGKRIAWAEDPEQRRFARQLVLEGNGPKKIAAALNKRFGLSVNGNSLGGFIFEHKGKKDGPAWFLEFLSEGEQVHTDPEKKAAKPTEAARASKNTEEREPPLPLSGTPPAETSEYAAMPSTEFSYEEYLRMSLREERHAPGNGPLRLKVPVKHRNKTQKK